MADYRMQISSLSPFNHYYIHSSECVSVGIYLTRFHDWFQFLNKEALKGMNQRCWQAAEDWAGKEVSGMCPL